MNQTENSSKLDLVVETLNDLKHGMSELKKRTRWQPRRPPYQNREPKDTEPKEETEKKHFRRRLPHGTVYKFPILWERMLYHSVGIYVTTKKAIIQKDR